MKTQTLEICPRPGWAPFLGLWKRIRGLGQRAPRRLRISESLDLGERRFVAVIEFEKSRFLVGGTASSLSLLTAIPDASEASEDRCDCRLQVAPQKPGPQGECRPRAEC